MPHVETVAAPCRAEIDKIKGSRFIGNAYPLAEAGAAPDIVEAVAREYPDASHHCWAYSLAPGGDQFRFSDAGEPSGTAGRPILDQLEGRDLCFPLVVVTRFFGGTKLGRGGLVRAYGAAAAAVLDVAEIRRIPITRTCVLELAYSDTAPIGGVLAAFDVTPREASYGEKTRLVVEVDTDRWDEFVREITDRTSGRVSIEARPSPS